MNDISKIIVFLFVCGLLIYMLKMTLYMKQKEELKTHTFVVLFVGILACAIATFLDMITPVFNSGIVNLIIRISFTLGAIFYTVGVMLWSNYTKKVIGKYEELALKDSMTEIFNRNGLGKIYKLVSERKKVFYLAMCDLDGLKKINDEFGHLEGDRYIAGTAKVMVETVGNKGYVGRIGGDEFTIILECQETKEVEEILNTIESLVCKICPGKETGISLGYAMFPDEGNNIIDLMKAADKKMYKNKGNKKR
jgi:diguanylate cyclase (GGDEF)-like protein